MTASIRIVLAVTALIACGATGAHSSQRIPLIEDHGVLYVRAKMDGVGPMLLTLDPGAADLYTSYARTRLHGRSPQSLCLGDFCLHAAMRYFDGDPSELDPKHDSRKGVIAGSVGPALLQRYVVGIDYRALALGLIPVESFRPPKGAGGLPMTVDEYGLRLCRQRLTGFRPRSNSTYGPRPRCCSVRSCSAAALGKRTAGAPSHDDPPASSRTPLSA